MSKLADSSVENGPCVFCYKMIDENDNQQERATSSLRRFFSVVDRLTRRHTFSLEWSSNLTDSGFQSLASLCGDCCNIVESFCQIHHEIKVLELRLHWKLESVKNVMRLADRVPSRVKYFRETMMEGLNTQYLEKSDCEGENAMELFRNTMTSRRDFIKQCSNFLSNSRPRVIISKCGRSTDGDEDEAFTADNSNVTGITLDAQNFRGGAGPIDDQDQKLPAEDHEGYISDETDDNDCSLDYHISTGLMVEKVDEDFNMEIELSGSLESKVFVTPSTNTDRESPQGVAASFSNTDSDLRSDALLNSTQANYCQSEPSGMPPHMNYGGDLMATHSISNNSLTSIKPEPVEKIDQGASTQLSAGTMLNQVADHAPQHPIPNTSSVDRDVVAQTSSKTKSIRPAGSQETFHEDGNQGDDVNIVPNARPTTSLESTISERLQHDGSQSSNSVPETRNLQLQCSVCQQNFATKRHLQQFHGNTRAIGRCNICDKQFSQKRQLNSHRIRMHKEGRARNRPTLVSKIHKRKLKAKAALKSHLTSHKMPEQSKSECNKSPSPCADTSLLVSGEGEGKAEFENVGSIEEPMGEEVRPQPPARQLRTIHKCSICQMTFSNLNRLQHHQETSHKADDDNSASEENDDDSIISSKVKVEEAVDLDIDWRDGFEYSKTSSPSSHRSSDSHDSDSCGNVLPSNLDPDQKITNSTKSNDLEILSSQTGDSSKAESSSSQNHSQDTGDNSKLDTKFPFHARNLLKNIKLSPDGMTITDLVYKKHAKYQCSDKECKKKFHTSDELDNHSKLHGNFHCSLCSQVETFAPALALHEATHSGVTSEISGEIKGFTCVRCVSKPFQIRFNYMNHFLETHMQLCNDKIKCPICQTGLEESIPNVLRKTILHHFTTHHGNPKTLTEDSVPTSVHKCDKCPAFFLKLTQLNKHRTNVHTDAPSRGRSTCEDCGHTFKGRYALRKHRTMVHKVERNIKCPVENCDDIFETELDLENHKTWIHSGACPLRLCPTCGKQCKGTPALKTHLSTHMEKHQNPSLKVWSCDQCGKTCNNKSGLQLHLLVHSGPESWEFSCEVCAKKCITQKKLEEHKRVHSQEKPFVCDTCGQAYAHAHNLRIHVNNKHKA